jgi:hypothetical protein
MKWGKNMLISIDICHAQHIFFFLTYGSGSPRLMMAKWVFQTFFPTLDMSLGERIPVMRLVDDYRPAYLIF